MAKSAKLGKESAVKAEFKRLCGIFSCLEPNKFDTLIGLIETAAYITVSIRELETLITANGYVEDWQNGEKQSGVKQSEYVKLHLAYGKQQYATLKTLADFAPPKQKKDTLLAALRK